MIPLRVAGSSVWALLVLFACGGSSSSAPIDLDGGATSTGDSSFDGATPGASDASTDGAGAGEGAAPIRACAGMPSGYSYCGAVQPPQPSKVLVTCSADGTSVTMAVCPSATPTCYQAPGGGRCVLCTPTEGQCAGNQPQQCASDGQSWQNVGSACAAPTPACMVDFQNAGGACHGTGACCG